MPFSPISPSAKPSITRRNCLLALAASGLAANAWASSASQSRQVRINISLEPDSLDITSSAAAANAQVAHYNIFQGLTQIQEDGSTKPCLAQSWEVSPDQRSWRFQLRPGVRFHDGQPLDSDCVVRSFTRASDPATGNKSQRTLFQNIAHLHAPDLQSVHLQLHHPNPHLLFHLGESGTVILHPDGHHSAATHPIGTGPYRLQQWQRGHSISLVKNPDYWGAAAHIPEASFHFANAAQEQQQALEEGRFDIFFQFASDDLNRFRHNPNYQVLLGASSGKGLLAFNHRHPALRDIRVRQAITHAIDREKFIQKALSGNGTVIGSHFSPHDPGYIRLASTYPYDPARARQLLHQAGVKTPLTLQLAVPPTPYALSGAPVLAQDLAEVGINVTLDFQTWQQWLAGPFKGQFELTLINHVEPLDYPIYADPNYYFGYDSPALRSLLERHASANNRRQQQLVFIEIQRFLAQEAVNAWIFNASIALIVRKGLQGTWINYPIFAHDIAAMRWA